MAESVVIESPEIRPTVCVVLPTTVNAPSVEVPLPCVVMLTALDSAAAVPASCSVAPDATETVGVPDMLGEPALFVNASVPELTEMELPSASAGAPLIVSVLPLPWFNTRPPVEPIESVPLKLAEAV